MINMFSNSKLPVEDAYTEPRFPTRHRIKTCLMFQRENEPISGVCVCVGHSSQNHGQVLQLGMKTDQPENTPCLLMDQPNEGEGVKSKGVIHAMRKQ